MATFIRTRTIKKRPYLYFEERWREGGKMRSRSTILNKRRKKRGGGFPAINPISVVLAVAAIGVYVAKYGLKGPHYKQLPEEPAQRARVVAEAQMRELARLYGVDESSREAFAKMRHLITPEYQQVRNNIVRAYRHELRVAREARLSPMEKQARDYQHQQIMKDASSTIAAVKEFKERHAEKLQATTSSAAPSYPPKDTPTDEEETRHANWSFNQQAQRDEDYQAYTAAPNSESSNPQGQSSPSAESPVSPQSDT